MPSSRAHFSRYRWRRRTTSTSLIMNANSCTPRYERRWQAAIPVPMLMALVQAAAARARKAAAVACIGYPAGTSRPLRGRRTTLCHIASMLLKKLRLLGANGHPRRVNKREKQGAFFVFFGGVTARVQDAHHDAAMATSKNTRQIKSARVGSSPKSM